MPTKVITDLEVVSGETYTINRVVFVGNIIVSTMPDFFVHVASLGVCFVGSPFINVWLSSVPCSI